MADSFGKFVSVFVNGVVEGERCHGECGGKRCAAVNGNNRILLESRNLTEHRVCGSCGIACFRGIADQEIGIIEKIGIFSADVQ